MYSCRMLYNVVHVHIHIPCLTCLFAQLCICSHSHGLSVAIGMLLVTTKRMVGVKTSSIQIWGCPVYDLYGHAYWGRHVGSPIQKRGSADKHKADALGSCSGHVFWVFLSVFSTHFNSSIFESYLCTQSCVEAFRWQHFLNQLELFCGFIASLFSIAFPQS